MTIGGNLFAHSHHCDDDHNDILENHQCLECIASESSTYYNSSTDQLYFNNTGSEFIMFFTPIFSYKAPRLFLSRAPPIS